MSTQPLKPVNDQSVQRTLVIIPALNEEEALPGVLVDLARHAPELDVLVVDDGSVDFTAEVAAAGGVQVARLPFNLGVGGALRTGFRYALEHGFDRAVQIDGDGQHDPAEIFRLLGALDEGSDLVIGSRFSGDRRSHGVALGRFMAMGMLRVVTRALSGRRFTDTSSGFRAFSRPMIAYFARRYPADYLGDTVEAILIACYGGFRVDEVPVSMRARAGGVPSSRRLRLAYHYVRLLVALAATARVRRPART